MPPYPRPCPLDYVAATFIRALASRRRASQRLLLPPRRPTARRPLIYMRELSTLRSGAPDGRRKCAC